MGISDLKHEQRSLGMLVRFANHLGITPRIGYRQSFDPRQEWATIWLPGGGNNVASLYRSTNSIEYFLWSLTVRLGHELAHYLVASPKLRRRKNYGINNGRRSARENRLWETNEAKVFFVEHHLREWIGIWRPKEVLQLAVNRGRREQLRPYRAEAKRWWKAEGEAMMDAELLAFTKTDERKRK